MTITMFPADYAGAIVVPADSTNFYTAEGHNNVPNKPRGLVLHTPEERADFTPSTPYYFQNPNIGGSTHYFGAFTGDLYQCVKERDMAFANAINGKPWPFWADPFTNLNWQTLSIEIEGYAASIHETMIRSEPQWNTVVKWIRDLCLKYDIPITREYVIAHSDVSIDRSDPGNLFPWDEILEDANKEDGEEDMKFVRWNGVAHYFDGMYIDGDQLMNARLDFALPADAKRIQMQAFLEGGTLIVLDGVGDSAPDSGRSVTPYGIVEPFLNSDGWLTLRGENAQLGRLAILGYWT